MEKDTHQESEQDEFLLYKTNSLLKKLSNMKSSSTGTSLITLLLPPNEQIPKIQNMLIGEVSSASSIKSRINRQSVQTALASCQQKLKLYRFVPKNGLVLLCGIVEMLLPDGTSKEKKINISFSPPKPLSRFIYKCDNKFHLDTVQEAMNTEEDTYGIIIISGDGTLYATLTGSAKNKIFEFGVELPKKHGRGGQSKLRFERLAEEARHNYLKKIGELATKFFVDPTKNTANIKGLIIGGVGSLKYKFVDNFLNERLRKPILLNITDTSYGSEQGLSETLKANTETFKDVKYVQERYILSKFFEIIAKNINKYCYGYAQTLKALEEGIIETLLVSENCPLKIKIKDMNETILEKMKSIDEDIETEDVPIVDYLLQACPNKGTKIILLSDASSEGSQFLMGFGGIGGFLRYDHIFVDENEDIEDNDEQNSEIIEEDLSEYFM